MSKLQALKSLAQGHYNPQQPRDSSGKWTSGGSSPIAHDDPFGSAPDNLFQENKAALRAVIQKKIGANPFGAAPAQLTQPAAKPSTKKTSTANPFGAAPAQLTQPAVKPSTKKTSTANPFGAAPAQLTQPAAKPAAKPADPTRHFAILEAGRSAIPAQTLRAIESLAQSPSLKTAHEAQQQLNQVNQQIQQRRAKGQSAGDLLSLRNKLDREAGRAKRQSDRDTRKLVEYMGGVRQSLMGSRAQAEQQVKDIKIDAQLKNASQIRSNAVEFLQIAGNFAKPKTITYTDPRASASAKTGIVNVGSKPPERQKSVLFHEMAHFIEFGDPEIGKASVDFVRSRATGGLKPLRELTKNNYTSEEVALPDHFVSPYVGKIYLNEKGKYLPASEVISMGLERMVSPESMAQFYKQDPEHFMFILGVLKGKKQ